MCHVVPSDPMTWADFQIGKQIRPAPPEAPYGTWYFRTDYQELVGQALPSDETYLYCSDPAEAARGVWAEGVVIVRHGQVVASLDAHTTESEWLASTDPRQMLAVLQSRSTRRKLLLFQVACCRRVQHLLDEDHCHRMIEAFRLTQPDRDLSPLPLNVCGQAIDLAERAADESVSADELGGLSCDAYEFTSAADRYLGWFERRSWEWEPPRPDPRWLRLGRREVFNGLMASGSAACAVEQTTNSSLSSEVVAIEAARAAGYLIGKGVGAADQACDPAEFAAQADLLRDIFCNPFRTPVLDRRWRTADVLGIARGIYEDRDFSRMPILGDALLDAGCDDDQVLAHCRSDRPHVKGCWVVDLLTDRK